MTQLNYIINIPIMLGEPNANHFCLARGYKLDNYCENWPIYCTLQMLNIQYFHDFAFYGNRTLD